MLEDEEIMGYSGNDYFIALKFFKGGRGVRDERQAPGLKKLEVFHLH